MPASVKPPSGAYTWDAGSNGNMYTTVDGDTMNTPLGPCTWNEEERWFERPEGVAFQWNSDDTGHATTDGGQTGTTSQVTAH